MTQLEELKIINDATLKYLKQINKDSKRNEIIGEILEDNKWFLKMDKKDAYEILEEIGIKSEDLNVAYFRLLREEKE